jgi:eukaryotic-like serine/threonine-protein kinase
MGTDDRLGIPGRTLPRTAVPQLPSPGEIVAGKYRVERRIGSGGMSVVFAAQHTTLRQRVAIKFLSLEQCESSTAVARFLHEGRAAARIRSEHVARVIDVDVGLGGLPYMVLEYLEGSDLAHTLQQRGPLPIDLAVDYVMEALEAVAEAHTLNVVHRDLKPANLFVVRRADGKKDIKVIDFGISKSLGDSDRTALTKQHFVLGSPEYMSPEQAQGVLDIDPRTDLWSMGVVLYELLSCSCPFEGADYTDVLAKVTREDPPSLAARCPQIPPALEAVVRRCLQRDRAARYQTAGDLARDLLPFGSERARISYDSILGVSLRAQAEQASEDEPDSSTQIRGQPLAPNEVARAEWKNLATTYVPPAIDGAISEVQAASSYDVELEQEALPPELLATKRSAGVPEKDRSVNEPAPAEAARLADQPVPARPALISVVDGPLPSLGDQPPTSSGEQWMHRPDLLLRRVPERKSGRVSAKGTYERFFFLALLALAAAMALMFWLTR